MAQARFSESPIPNPQSPAPQEPKMSSIDFTSFLKLMAHQKASDLFITAGMPPSIKVNGKISPITQNPLTPQQARDLVLNVRSDEHTTELQSLMRISYAVFCLKNKKNTTYKHTTPKQQH